MAGFRDDESYIERFHLTRNGGTYETIPKMDELMAETYGVMVCQEDVLKVAHHFAGLTLTEADVLRRAMICGRRDLYGNELIIPIAGTRLIVFGNPPNNFKAHN